MRLFPRPLGCNKRLESLPFCEIWNNRTLYLFLNRSPYKYAMQGMEFYDKFMTGLQDLSKVQNPAVSKAKV